MDEAHLVGVHEARIAHHVAAVGQVDRQHRTAPVGDRAAAVLVQLRIVVRADVAAREHLFQVLEERRIDRHHVFEVAVDRAILHHQDLAVALDHLRLDLARLVGVEDFERGLAVQNLLADFRHAARAQGIGFTRPAQWRLGLFPALQQRLVAPLRREAGVLADLVEFIEHEPGRTGGVCQSFLSVFNRLVHVVRTPPESLRSRYFHTTGIRTAKIIDISAL